MKLSVIRVSNKTVPSRGEETTVLFLTQKFKHEVESHFRFEEGKGRKPLGIIEIPNFTVPYRTPRSAGNEYSSTI
jgi:hypothetical protein